ncbi:MAG: hypothetical protein ABIN69_16285 [Aestuariivirga sp.]
MAKTNSDKRSGRTNGATSGGYRLMDDVMGLAETLFKNRREYGAEKLQSVAEATRGYAASLNSFPGISEKIDELSDSMTEFSEYISDTDIEHLISDAGLYARRKPIATMGIALVVGAAATQLLMAATREPRRASNSQRGSGARSKSPVMQFKRKNGSAARGASIEENTSSAE